MASVSENIVREYFELQGFLVRQHRKYIARGRREEDDIDFFVLNPHPEPLTAERPFVLSSSDLRSVERAVVVVRGWHTEIFSPARLALAPEILRFVEPGVFRRAIKAFGAEAMPLKVLVVPALPQNQSARQETISFLRNKGVDAVLPFRTMLADLVEQVEPNRNYQKSDILQILRILKNYEFFREQQLELFRPGRRRRR
ncbi:MAG TPA: hypothetical protein PLW35_11600 [Verrucomicrobiota bacterium]|nr:hypothetical protein [Verrucomicrobiota bacterium]